MTEESYRKEIQTLVFDRPLSESVNQIKWNLPELEPGESYSDHVQRLRRYKARYFEQLKKLEDGRSLLWL